MHATVLLSLALIIPTKHATKQVQPQRRHHRWSSPNQAPNPKLISIKLHAKTVEHSSSQSSHVSRIAPSSSSFCSIKKPSRSTRNRFCVRGTERTGFDSDSWKIRPPKHRRLEEWLCRLVVISVVDDSEAGKSYWFAFSMWTTINGGIWRCFVTISVVAALITPSVQNLECKWSENF